MPRLRLLLPALVVALAAGSGCARSQEASPDVAAGPAPPLVVAYAEALNAHDPDRVAALYQEDAVVVQAVHDGNTFRGRAEIAAWVADNLGGVPDLAVTTDSVIAEGDRIAWAWVYHGAYTGRYPGLPAGHGQPIELRGVSLFDLRDGRIARETVYFDNATFLAEADESAGATPMAAPGS